MDSGTIEFGNVVATQDPEGRVRVEGDSGRRYDCRAFRDLHHGERVRVTYVARGPDRGEHYAMPDLP
jgi:hypothetical protein